MVPKDPLPLISFTAHGIGSALEKFHNAGFYLYSPAPDNYSYSPALNAVYIMDLDSCRYLSELNDVQKPLYKMRDVASALYYMTAYFTDPKRIDRFDPEAVLDADPFAICLVGYFGDNMHNNAFAISKAVVQPYYLSIYNNVQNRKEEILENHAKHKAYVQTIEDNIEQ